MTPWATTLLHLHPWNFPGKSTGVGCHFLLQGIFLTQGSNPGLPLCRQTLYCLSHQGNPCGSLPINPYNIEIRSSLMSLSPLSVSPDFLLHSIFFFFPDSRQPKSEKTGAHCWPQATPTLPKKSGIFPLSLWFILGAPATEVAGLPPGGHLRQSTFLQFQKLPNG